MRIHLALAALLLTSCFGSTPATVPVSDTAGVSASAPTAALGMPQSAPPKSTATATPLAAAEYEAFATGTLGPPGLAAGRVAAYRPLILATFAPPGASDAEYVPYFSYDGAEWTRIDLPRHPGEIVTALGVSPNRRYVFVGTSEGRILRREPFSIPGQWEEVYAAPRGTFQPVVTGFAFHGDRVYAALKGVLTSATGRRFEDWTPGLGDLEAAIEHRGRFGTSNPAPIGGRVIVGIGGVMPGSTGTWVRTAEGRWERTGLEAEHRFVVLDEEVVAVRITSAVGIAPAHVSRDAGRTWLEAAVGAPLVGFINVAASSVGAIALSPDGLFRLRPDLNWERLAAIATDRWSFAVSGRDVFVPHVSGLQRFRIERPLAADPEFCGVEQTRQGQEWYVRDAAMRECLWQAYLAGTTARLVSYAYTIEGGPIVRTITVDGGRIAIFIESNDPFGFTGELELSCTNLTRSGPDHLDLDATGCSGPEDRFVL
ncbi:MAG: hypothetical protein ACRDGT_08595 [Candidatus Limnocylindria bacterium]